MTIANLREKYPHQVFEYFTQEGTRLSTKHLQNLKNDDSVIGYEPKTFFIKSEFGDTEHQVINITLF